MRGGVVFWVKMVDFGLKRGLRGLISLIGAFICLSRVKMVIFGSKMGGSV